MRGTVLSVFFAAVAVYSQPVNPREHPDDARRPVKPPDRTVLGDKLHFTSMRRMNEKKWRKSLEDHVYRDRLGNVIWPDVELNELPNIDEIIEYFREHKDIIVFDSACGWPDHRGDLETFDRVSDRIRRALGPRWLGWDLGEQDGRYAIAFSDKIHPFGADRLHQYIHFQDFFENANRMLGNDMSTLISCNYGHYFLRENCFHTIGAETALSLPNSQVYYAFIRGAGKRHGVPWFGNVSIWNRWGWKAYNDRTPENLEPETTRSEVLKHPMPERGTSLALMKRLMYSHVFYNCWMVGIENCFYWFAKEHKGELSPIGVLQREVRDWSERNGNPGVQHVPVAIMLDFYSGWAYPRHNYDYGRPYRVWANLPYRPGDYFAADVLGMLYPGYEDSGYFQDERGFATPTPYGDIADCLLSDTPLWLLKRYPVLVLANEISPSAEFVDKMQAYLDGGGHLVATRGNMRNLPGLRGQVTVLDSEWGVTEKPQCALPPSGGVERPLANPYPLVPAVRVALDGIFRSQTIFSVSESRDGDGLLFVTCRRKKGEYTVLIENATFEEKPFSLQAKAGRILSVDELPVAVGERTARGWLPLCIATNGTFKAGADTATTIAAQSVRTFRVRLDEGVDIREIPHERPPAAPKGVSLALRGTMSVKEHILRRPTFFEHYDGVMVDWKYIRMRDRRELERERNWIDLQSLHVTVDMTQAFNWFPDLNWYSPNTNNTRIVRQNDAILDEVLSKMPLIGAKDVVVATDGRMGWTKPSFTNKAVKALNEICRRASQHGITVHLRPSPVRFIRGIGLVPQWVNRSSPGNLRTSPMLAALMADNAPTVPANKITDDVFACAGTPGILLASAAEKDEFGRLESLHEPLAAADRATRRRAKSIIDAMRAKGVRIIFEAVYPDADAEYRDCKMFTESDCCSDSAMSSGFQRLGAK